MNTKFAKLNEDGTLTYAPDILIVDGRVLISASEAMYNAQGWLTIHDEPPTPPTGYHNVAAGWEVRDGAIYRVYTQEADPVTYRAWTPLTLLRGAKSGGFWTAIKTVLEANDAYDEFMASQYCAECDDGFVAIKAIIVAQIGAEATETFLNGLKVEKRGTREQLLEEVA